MASPERVLLSEELPEKLTSNTELQPKNKNEKGEIDIHITISQNDSNRKAIAENRNLFESRWYQHHGVQFGLIL